MKRIAILALGFVLLAGAQKAAAETFLNPFVGTTLSSPSSTGSHSKPGVGISFGSSGGFIGAETEVTYFPELLDNSANKLSKSRVVTFSANTLIGPHIGPVKVYGAFGFGGLYLNVSSVSSIVVPDPQSVTNNYFTFNVGGGAMGYFSSHFGVRGDLRYFRAFGFSATDVQNTGTLTLNKFDFWRANVGLAIRF